MCKDLFGQTVWFQRARVCGRACVRASAQATQVLESTLEKTIERERKRCPRSLPVPVTARGRVLVVVAQTVVPIMRARARPQLKSAHVPPRVFILVNIWANWRDDKLAWNVRDILSRD